LMRTSKSKLWTISGYFATPPRLLDKENNIMIMMMIAIKT